MDFCRANKILFKEYKTWMMKQTRCLVDYADQYAKANCGQGVIHIPTYRVNKEELARRRQAAEQIERGIIGVWSCQESGRSFYDAAQTILDRPLDVRWTNLLNGFPPTVFPMMSDVLGPYLSYYWTVWQSEWASDLIFDSPCPYYWNKHSDFTVYGPPVTIERETLSKFQ